MGVRKSQFINYLPTIRQKSIIVGSLLGDGSLTKVSKNTNSYFNEGHCLAQYEWLNWKRKELFPLASSSIKIRKTHGMSRDSSGNLLVDKTKFLYNCSFATLSCKWFTNLEKLWYKRNCKKDYIFKKIKNGKKQRIKILPSNLKLNPLILAVWYLDDGCNIVSKKTCVLATNGFLKKEVKYLLSQLKQMGFHDVSMIKTRQKHKFVICIKPKSSIDFINLIKKTIPDIPECMKYKIDQSQYKIPWTQLSTYHPNSLFNDQLVLNIFRDAKSGMSQKDIAKKYTIKPRSISSLLKGNLKRYQSQFGGYKNYRNKTNIPNFFFSKKEKVYIGIVVINKQTICLGRYRNKKIAKKVSKEVMQLKINQCTDKYQYKAIVKKYKLVQNNNSTGVNGITKNRNKFLPTILINKKRIHLGLFNDLSSAEKVLNKAIEMRNLGIIDIDQYIQIRPKIKRKYSSLPKGITWSESRQKFIAFFKRKSKYCNALEEAIVARKELENNWS